MPSTKPVISPDQLEEDMCALSNHLEFFALVKDKGATSFLFTLNTKHYAFDSKTGHLYITNAPLEFLLKDFDSKPHKAALISATPQDLLDWLDTEIMRDFRK